MKQTLAQISLAIIFTGWAFGQSAETLPSFEAADVHVSPKSSNTQTGGGFLRGGRYQFRNATMVDLISSAYGVDPEKVLGGPSWLESDRFDIIAKAPASASNDTAKLMLRALLADRFKLVIRNEDRPLTVYALTLGKGKHQLKAGTGATGCQGQPQNPQPGVVPYQVVSCHSMTMKALAESLRQMAPAYIDNSVVDLTGLEGAWDFDIKWTGRGNLAAAGSDGITIFDAVEKQLGLKLELQKRASPVIVVDRVNQKPTDNSPGLEKILPVVPTEFEVADIKPTALGTEGRRGNIQPGGRLDLQGGALKDLIMLAWDINTPDFIVTPKWLETERFDVVAKAPSDVSISGNNVDVDTLRAMLRALLIDRFKLTFHNENQPVSVFALLSPRREPKLKKADPSARASCKRTVGSNAASSTPLATLTCQNTTMAQLAEGLQGWAGAYVDHPAIDLTELDGGWDFTLSWTPRGAFEGGGARGQAPNQTPGAASAASDPTGSITLFEALEKQLGLKLESQKHPMPVLVIDHVEQKPMEN